MADGDIIHGELSGPYRKPYKWLCEGKADNNECARVLMSAILRDLKNKGVAPVRLAKQMAESLKQFINNGCRDWVAMSKKLDWLAQQASCSHYLRELVLRPSKSILHNIRYSKAAIDTRNLSEAITEGYIQEVYKSNFEQRIPDKGADNDTVMNRVKALNSEVYPEIKKWAKQANVDGDVSKLRLPRRQKVKEIDLGENLL
ncbi:hypothetical protein [Dapis sp. BLCC M229]|uniref:hypothetical protein n=1 Tax=Dapis sp. BLCC M229 TaxID=3400188 RepID=UPI003CF871F9